MMPAIELSKPGGQNHRSSSGVHVFVLPHLALVKGCASRKLANWLTPIVQEGFKLQTPGRLRALEANVHAGEAL